ncbi:MAG: aldehyde dehydrogenase family protein [Candidatus Nitrotoga sp.]
MTGTALLLVDMQQDFLQTQALQPDAGTLVARVALLLTRCRQVGILVFHVRTLVTQDGGNRMPHWRRNGDRRCIEGSSGAESPPALQALLSERVYAKPYFSAFGNPSLHEDLRQAGVKSVLVAGVHTHACVHATVLDAYQLGYSVKLVVDAIGSYNPLHAELSLAHLVGRACEPVEAAALFPENDLRPRDTFFAEGGRVFPVRFTNGCWHAPAGHELLENRDVCEWGRTSGRVPIGGGEDVATAALLAALALEAWSGLTLGERLSVLQSWRRELERKRSVCVDILIREIGKPRSDAEAEFSYALGLLDETLDRVKREAYDVLSTNVSVRYRARGVIAVVTPWNNPLALPVGKIAPALAYGNSLVWKPAPQAPELVLFLIETLQKAGLPDNCITVVMGDAETVRALLRRPEVSAVSFTGSETAGNQIAGICGLRGIALQAELGGNNAALISANADIDNSAAELAMAAFSFSGQRCTAPRRLIVEETVRERFCEALLANVRKLVIGNPDRADTHIGPLISMQDQARMEALVDEGLKEGGRLLAGGRVPSVLKHGCWFAPTVFTDLPEVSELVQEESFGPLVVVQEASSFRHGIDLCNQVRQGLRAILYSGDESEQDIFVKEVKVGVIHINMAASRIAPDAPFLGWKSSGMGLPEHGHWDRDFYTRTQAVYRSGLLAKKYDK